MTPTSYLLQSKMAPSFIDAGINSTEITSVSTLTGEKDLMTYILEYEWSNGKNEAYEALMNTLNSKRDELKKMKTAEYVLDPMNNTCKFVSGEEDIVIINGNTGEITNKDGEPFLTDNVDTELNAVATYSEYAMMYKSLNDNAVANPSDTVLPQMAVKVAERGSSFEYSE